MKAHHVCLPRPLATRTWHGDARAPCEAPALRFVTFHHGIDVLSPKGPLIGGTRRRSLSNEKETRQIHEGRMSAPPTQALLTRVPAHVRGDRRARRRRKSAWRTHETPGVRAGASKWSDEVDEEVAANSSRPGDKYWRAADVAGTAAQWMGWMWMAFAAATEASAPPAAVAAAACGTLARRAARRKLQAEQERLHMTQMERRLAKSLLAVGEDAKAARGAALAAARTAETAAATQAKSRPDRTVRQQEHVRDKEYWEKMRAFLDARLSLLEEAVEESSSTRQEDVRNAATAAVAQAQARILPPATSFRFPSTVENEYGQVSTGSDPEDALQKDKEMIAKLDHLAELLQGMQQNGQGKDIDQYRDEEIFTYQAQEDGQSLPIESWIDSTGETARTWTGGSFQDGLDEEHVNCEAEIDEQQNGKEFEEVADENSNEQRVAEGEANTTSRSMEDTEAEPLTYEGVIDVEAATWREVDESEWEGSSVDASDADFENAKDSNKRQEEVEDTTDRTCHEDGALGSEHSRNDDDGAEPPVDLGTKTPPIANPSEDANPSGKQGDPTKGAIELQVREGLELLRTGRMQARSSGSALGQADANLRSAIAEFERALSLLGIPYPNSNKQAAFDFGDDGDSGTKRRLAVVATGNLGNALLARAELQQRLLEILRGAPPPPPADYEATIAAELQLLEEVQDFLIEAGRRFRQVLQLTALLGATADREEAMKDRRKVDSALRALFNWGTALSLRALVALDSIEEADKEDADFAESTAIQLYFAALEKFERAEKLSRDDESMARALRGEAQILQDLAMLPSKTVAQKRELLKDALFRLDDAMELSGSDEGLAEARDECALLLREVS